MPQCPFHGKIIPRDDAGRPLDPEDRAREQRQQLQRQAERPGRSLRGPATPSLVVLGVHCLRGSQHARASGGASSCSSCRQLAGRVWFPGDVSAGLGRRVGARCPSTQCSVGVLIRAPRFLASGLQPPESFSGQARGVSHGVGDRVCGRVPQAGDVQSGRPCWADVGMGRVAGAWGPCPRGSVGRKVPAPRVRRHPRAFPLCQKRHVISA